MKYSAQVAQLERKAPEPLFRYVAVERNSDSPTGFIDVFSREPVNPDDYDGSITVEWVEPQQSQERAEHE